MEPQVVWRRDLVQDAKPMAWIWHGFLAPGWMTMLTSQWKSGKTTLVSMLLAKRASGGSLAGQAVTPGGTLVVSEEPKSLWERRCRKLDPGERVCFLCRPYKGKPTMAQWLELLQLIGRLHQEHGFDLVVFDSLNRMLPVRHENFAAEMTAALDPLCELTERGLAILILHHPKKGAALEGQMSRGSGAKDGIIDICMEMTKPKTPGSPRRRRIVSASRFEETPPRLLLDWLPDGTDYAVVDETEADDFAANWAYVRMVLEDADDKATRRELHDDWPADFPKPAGPTLWRWLERAVGDGLVRRDGTGRRAQPFRYWLPSKEEEWKNDPLHAILHPEPIDIPGLEHLRRLSRKRGG